MMQLLDSLRRHGYAYEVLGFGQPWNGFRTKMQNYLAGIQAYKAQAGPDALAAFVDAFDTTAIKSASAVAASYAAKPRPMPILFGAEICCYLNCRKETLQWYDKHSIYGGSKAVRKMVTQVSPGSDDVLISKQSVFLNSGLILGPAAHLEQMFQEMATGPEEDDQLAAGAYMVNNMDLVDLDLEESIFRNKIEPRTALPDEGTPSGPAILHFPGMRDDTEQAKMLNIIRGIPQP